MAPEGFYLLPVRWHALRTYSVLGKFGSPSANVPTVSSRCCRDKSAFGMVRSSYLREIYTAFGTLDHYFPCLGADYPCSRCAVHRSFDNRLDYFLHYFLGSQPIFGRDRHTLKTGEKTPSILNISITIFLRRPMSLVVDNIFSICPAIRYFHECCYCLWVSPSQILDQIFPSDPSDNSIYRSLVRYVFYRVF